MLNYVLMLGFDCIFSIFLILNLVVFIWRIIWDTQDIFFDQDKYFISAISSIIISFFLMLYVKTSQVKAQYKDTLQNSKQKSWKNKAKLKFFIIVFSFVNINQWRGVWYLTLYYTNQSQLGVFTIGLLSVVGLIAMNRLCALISVPYILNKDCAQLASNNYLKLNEYNVGFINKLTYKNLISIRLF